VGGFAVGMFFGFLLGVWGSTRAYNEATKEIVGLRVALSLLVQACEGDTCTLNSDAINEALPIARKALDNGKTQT